MIVDRYAVGGSKDEWAAAEAQVAAKVNGGKGVASVVSVKNPESTKGSKRKAGAEAGGVKSEGTKDKKEKKRRKN